MMCHCCRCVGVHGPYHHGCCRVMLMLDTSRVHGAAVTCLAVLCVLNEGMVYHITLSFMTVICSPTLWPPTHACACMFMKSPRASTSFSVCCANSRVGDNTSACTLQQQHGGGSDHTCTMIAAHTASASHANQTLQVRQKTVGDTCVLHSTRGS